MFGGQVKMKVIINNIDEDALAILYDFFGDRVKVLGVEKRG